MLTRVRTLEEQKLLVVAPTLAAGAGATLGGAGGGATKRVLVTGP